MTLESVRVETAPSRDRPIELQMPSLVDTSDETGEASMPWPLVVGGQRSWLAENGPEKLELLFRAIVYHHRSVPILIADNDRKYCDASSGAGRLLGLSRDQIIGRSLDEFAEPSFRPKIGDLWRAFLQRGEQQGTLHLVGPDGNPREVEYAAKGNVLPVRHLLVLRDKGRESQTTGDPPLDDGRVPSWARDFALFLLNVDGVVVAWYSGAERIYGYTREEVVGQHVSLLYPCGDRLRAKGHSEFKKVLAQGHVGDEGWRVRKDGSQFWANVVTMALKNQQEELQGFAVVARDFSERHAQDLKLRNTRTQPPLFPESAVAGVACGEFDRIPEANDVFLDLVGYTREDLLAGRLNWPDVTPPEYSPFDELAQEEALRFGACTPYEKELIRKDGTRIPVLIAIAILKLLPFRWISFVQDLRERDRIENVKEETIQVKRGFEEIIGTSAPLKRVLAQVEVVAPTDATVLILGETGTGKELIARAMHKMSSRRQLPFITLNCAAIPTGLLESELFGYERGAFTGALSRKIGRFEMANHGTLFLDEVGDIPLDLQPKLLRALQEKTFERLGGTRTIPIDVRLVAATNRNLKEMMAAKLFRSDLYYRLKVFPITLPPLRDHPQDIPLLARYFTRKFARKMNRQIDKIPTQTMRTLVSWPWRGNVRELENFIERSVILSGGPTLSAPLAELQPIALESAEDRTLEQVERDYIVHILRETNNVVSAAATRLGLPRTTLNAMMRKLGISRKARL
jgi:formate hydrogenlyase transcriptional activator